LAHTSGRGERWIKWITACEENNFFFVPISTAGRGGKPNEHSLVFEKNETDGGFFGTETLTNAMLKPLPRSVFFF
jgi:hypothetical protein